MENMIKENTEINISNNHFKDLSPKNIKELINKPAQAALEFVKTIQSDISIIRV